ncbi:MAG TPA: DNA mismatch repair endonuclease MutH [Polyangiales bacterium]|jgi:DNA mismatch repair protein MutH|nr:DNA mismatch repair endonuclease MutH [Polyangiales bacterium]
MVVAAAATAAVSDVQSLLRRARGLSGLTLRELAERLGAEPPSDARREKGYIGRLVERALGAAGSGAIDFPALGIELKTLPVDALGRPKESTFVCHADLRRLADLDWERSRVCEKLAHVLFVPIESRSGIAFGARRVGAAFLWRPSEEQRALLRADYEEIAGRVGLGEIETLDGRVGRVMQTRPKAANARARARAADANGASQVTFPRAFYLRASFTRQLLAEAFAAPNAL